MAEDKQQAMRIIMSLAAVWLLDPQRRLCDVLEEVCSGPFAGVDDTNLERWLADAFIES